jgi:hypothetical protein
MGIHREVSTPLIGQVHRNVRKESFQENNQGFVQRSWLRKAGVNGSDSC